MNDHDVIIALCVFDVLLVLMFAAVAVALGRLERRFR